MKSALHQTVWIVRRLLALLAFPLIGFLAARVWSFSLVEAGLVEPGGGFFMYMAYFTAFWSLIFGLVVWHPFWRARTHRWGRMSATRALVSAMLGSILFSLFTTRLEHLTLEGPTPLHGYMKMAAFVLGAWVHNLIARPGPLLMRRERQQCEEANHGSPLAR